MDFKELKSRSFDSSPKKSNPQLGYLGLKSKSKDLGIDSGKDLIFRADEIDFKNWDVQLEKQLARIWSKQSEIQEEWEIDLAGLDIKNVIDHGAYGTVYQAVYDGQDVAVKVLDWGEEGHATVADAYAFHESFQQQVKVSHKLDHPHVTKFIGATMGIMNLKIPSDGDWNTDTKCLQSKGCCVAVEYLQGGTLKKFLIKNSRKKLSFKIVVQLALDLSRGLSYLHSRNIVHHDVKMENMLLDPNGRLKIADFGVARVEAQNPKDMTRETGSVGYMAPEVLEGKPYSRKCDVYNLGICLWEIYCCDMPYADLSSSEVTYAVVHQNLRPSIPKCCPSSFATILKKCWDVNPEKRPEMVEVVRLLEAIDTSRGGGMVPDDQASDGCFCLLRPRGP